MRILAIADVEEPWLYDHLDRHRLDEADLIISCGDLSARYLEFVATMARVPLLYVPGNHDEAYVSAPPEGCINIDGKLWEGKGLRIFGAGGSMRYRTGTYMYTESQMRRRVRRLVLRRQLARGLDILVTHAPARGYGDLNDLPHRGFEAFNELMDKYRPSYLLHGHVHMSYGRIERKLIHPSGTRILNVYGSQLIDVTKPTR